jgi:hypothetical protein
MTFPSFLGKLILLLTLIGIFSGSAISAQQTDESKTDPAQSSPAAKSADPVSSDTSDWIVMKPTGANVEFKMPTKPRYVERSFRPVEAEPPIKVHLHISSFNQGAGGFVLSYHDLHTVPKTAKEIDAVLNGAVAGAIENVLGKPLPQERNGVSATQFKIRYGNNLYQVSSRVFLVGARQYQISALMEQSKFDSELVAAYLGTFRLVKPEPEPELESETDLETSAEEKVEENVEEKAEEKAD